MVKLDNKVIPSRNVSFVCLNRNAPLNNGESVIVAGWGRTENASSSSTLLQVTVPVNDDSVCSAQFNNYDSATQICAGEINARKDSCQGDSGGPLMKKINDHWTIVGIVSFGDSECNGFGVYTKVTSFYDWIVTNI